MNTTSNEKSYFDLHTSGIGYIQRVREVPVRGGRRAQPFLACTIAALVGPARDPSYRYFDVKVSGAEAKKLVQRYIGVDDPKQRPLVRFRLGDLWGDAYIRDKGEQKGQAAASLKARLLKAELIDRAELASIEQHELITRGIGYLNRVKDVTPKAGDSFLSCTVAALAGPVDEPEYRYFDIIVATPEAEHLARRCVQAIEGDRKVLIAFRLNDMKIDPYIRTKGEHAGEPAASLESTLVHIGLIKIDGTQVYPTSQAQAEASPAEDASASEARRSHRHCCRPRCRPACRARRARARGASRGAGAGIGCFVLIRHGPSRGLAFSYSSRRTIMAATPAPEKSVAPIVVPGQLTLRTIRGKNGPFTVGRLATHLGTFEVKDPELEQYPEGKYDGEFVIRYIFPKSYPVGGGMRFEIRASLDGMTLNGIDKLEPRRSPQLRHPGRRSAR
ncbi:hypothetical protein SSTU70S_03711 [Stutzerimonas stutzeri]